MFRYRALLKQYKNEEMTLYFSYSITLNQSNVRLEDVTTELEKAQRIVNLLNAGQVDPQHLLSFVSTFLDDV